MPTSLPKCSTRSLKGNFTRPCEIFRVLRLRGKLFNISLIQEGCRSMIQGRQKGKARNQPMATGLLVCLACGYTGCHAQRHASNHSMATPNHSVLYGITPKKLFCAICKKTIELSADPAFENVKACVDIIDHILDPPKGPPPKSKNPPKKPTYAPKAHVQTKVKYTPTPPSRAIPGFNGIKGLTNLGNTCFFNAVLQVISSAFNIDCAESLSLTFPVSTCHPRDARFPGPRISTQCSQGNHHRHVARTRSSLFSQGAVVHHRQDVRYDVPH